MSENNNSTKIGLSTATIIGMNAMIGAGMCCNPFGAYFMNKSIEQGRQGDKFSKCPECNSVDITKKVVYHDKK